MPSHDDMVEVGRIGIWGVFADRGGASCCLRTWCSRHFHQVPAVHAGPSWRAGRYGFLWLRRRTLAETIRTAIEWARQHTGLEDSEDVLRTAIMEVRDQLAAEQLLDESLKYPTNLE